MGTPDVVFMEITNDQQQTATKTGAKSIYKPERIRRGAGLLEQSRRKDTGDGRESDGSLKGLPRDIEGFKPRANLISL